ncbi:SdrD B-like domain-containing protein [Paenibacillus dendritiformis]|uniref:SdrD B-like domain-containing protein n=1 Tax=Paenibacillus dendritiformis TaxID=130049 RepID=UPI000DA929D1|nr:SdrD B-like domain-containing protein [Paenibacillus dendritiformis]PZM66395.1 hypothetical protein DOE73_06915 [Paenibacillus dendritiformis]
MRRSIRFQAIVLAFMLLFNILLMPMTALADDVPGSEGNGADTIQIVLKSSMPSVLSGQLFTYDIEYSVSSTTEQYDGAEIVLPIPKDVEYVGVVNSDGATAVHDPDAGTVTFTFAEALEPGSTGTLQVNVRFPNYVTPNGTEAAAQAVFRSEQTPGGKLSNEVTVKAEASAAWDLTKEQYRPVAHVKPQPGGTVEYRILFSDTKKDGYGNLNLDDVVITDMLPPEAELLSTRPEYAANDNGKLTWNIGKLGKNESYKEIFVKVKYPEDILKNNPDKEVVNQAAVSFKPVGENEPVTDEAEAKHGFVDVPQTGNLWIYKSVNEGSAKELITGQTVSYRIGDIANQTNMRLENAKLEDVTPQGLEFVQVQTARFAGIDSYVIQYTTKEKPADSDWEQWETIPANAEPRVLKADGKNVKGIRLVFGDVPVDFQQKSELEVQYKKTGEYRQLEDYVFGKFSDIPYKKYEGNFPEIDRLNGLPENDKSPKDRKQIVNYAVMTYLFNGEPKENAARVKVLAVEDRPLIMVKKQVVSGAALKPGETATYKIRVTNPDFIDVDFRNPIVTDLLPEELAYVDDSVKVTGSDGVNAPQPRFKSDSQGPEGTTPLTWYWDENHPLTLKKGQWVELTFQAKVKAGVTTGTIHNEVEVTSEEHEYLNNYYNFVQQRYKDGKWYVYDGADIHVNSATNLESVKYVQGDLDEGSWTVYPDTGTVTPGGKIKYKVVVTNKGTVGVKNVTIVDALPRIGDTGVIDKTPRGSKWSPVLTEKVATPESVTVYYSTDESVSLEGGSWSAEAPEDLTTIKALKFVFDDDLVLKPGESKEVVWEMSAPVGAPSGDDEIAWNSFGFTAKRADNGSPLLPAEPKKVGVKIKDSRKGEIGDYVWIDKNGNGIQDDDEEGKNGVTVELYDINGKLLNKTITNTNFEGKPGYYLFTNLPAGKYIVKFILPDGYSWTKPHQGNDPAKDSDVINEDGYTDEIVLGDGEKNHNIDAGLVPMPVAPETGEIGDYVWIDKNGNGIQDEDEIGLNGVKVELYDDNGSLLKSTTTDNKDGKPGYYLFTNLPAGKYVVKFILPNGHKWTIPHQGDDRGKDSDVTHDDGRTNVIELAKGEKNHDIDAGLIPLPVAPGTGALGDYVWIDKNGNGIQDEDEVGLNGVTVKLYNSNRELLATTVTQSVYKTVTDSTYGGTVTGDVYGPTVTEVVYDGYYLFDNLSAGTYIVHFELPDGYKFTIKGAGSDPARHSKANADGWTDVIMLGQGERNLTIDAGLIKSGVKPEPERPDPEGPGSGGGGTTDPGSGGTTPGTNPPDNRETVPGTIVEGPDTIVGGETDPGESEPGETVPGTPGTEEEPGTEEQPGSNELPANRPGDRKKPDHPAAPTLPATGEKAPLAPWIGLLFCAAAVVMWMSRNRMKHNE